MGESIITRSEALARGLRDYFTGKPCVNGHIAKRRTKLRHCRDCLRERSVAAYRKDPDKHKQCNKNWKANNPEKIKKYCDARKKIARDKAKKYYIANRETIRIRVKQWQVANPLIVKANKSARRARKRGAGGKHSANQILDLHQKQKFKCANCKRSICTQYHVDHIMPIKLGGSDDIRNIQLLCPSCNLEKGCIHPIDWAQDNGRLL